MSDRVKSADAMLVFELATENSQLRALLAEAQDLLVESAIDAGELHAQVEDLRAQLAEALAMIPYRRAATAR